MGVWLDVPNSRVGAAAVAPHEWHDDRGGGQWVHPANQDCAYPLPELTGFPGHVPGSHTVELLPLLKRISRKPSCLYRLVIRTSL